MSRIGIVTVTYNSETVLPDFIRCLKAQDHQDFVLYIVDNRSSDASADLIERLCREQGLAYRILRNDINLGIACGNNQGIRMALADGCDPILIANNDIEFESDTFTRILDLQDERPNDLILPKVVFHDAPDTIWCAGGRLSRLRGVPQTAGYREHDGPRFSEAVYTYYAPTCFLIVPSMVFREVGLMDEDYFVYLDDSDFTVRALKAGHRIYYTPEPRIGHKVSVSTGGADSPFTIYQISKNTILFLHKNNSTPLAIWYILVFLARSSLHLWRYRNAQRVKLFEGLRDGLRFVIQRPIVKHNIPTL
jgi:hypothetical protein